MPDVHRADQQDDLVIEVDADLLHHVAGVHKRARLMMHGDREDAELRLTLETSAEDATTWEPESSTRAEALLRRLADRELRLEAAAARLGMTGELLLDSLASTTLPDEDAASSIPASELASLRGAGINLTGPAEDATGVGQVIRGRAAVHHFRESALSVAQAARVLGVTEGRVRQQIKSKAIAAIPGGDGTHRLPAWQFVGSTLVPGLGVINERTYGVHPLTVAGFMTRVDPDLVVDEESVSPVEWLLSGGEAQVVADLATGLRGAA